MCVPGVEWKIKKEKKNIEHVCHCSHACLIACYIKYTNKTCVQLLVGASAAIVIVVVAAGAVAAAGATIAGTGVFVIVAHAHCSLIVKNMLVKQKKNERMNLPGGRDADASWAPYCCCCCCCCYCCWSCWSGCCCRKKLLVEQKLNVRLLLLLPFQCVEVLKWWCRSSSSL